MNDNKFLSGQVDLRNCNICNFKTETVYKLKFMDIFGMIRGEYEQKINICPNCGFIYTLNPFGEEALANRYKNWSKFEYDENDVFNANVPYMRQCERQYDFIKNTVGRTGSVFEVGSSSGFNLSIYARDGVDVFGVEPSKSNVISCKQRYGIDMFNGTFREYMESDANKGPYELIFLSHVLEHIINPYNFISALSGINSRYMFIEVPSFDYKFCDEPFGMFAEEHVNYFTVDNLRNLMRKAGYGVIDVNMHFSLYRDIPAGCPVISTLWEKAGFEKDRSLTADREPVLSSKKLLMSYIGKSIECDKKIIMAIDGINGDIRLAVWGTGHHTSRLLGMTSLKDKNIIKFYDSDIKKQGIEYHGRKILPFDPADVESGEVDMILISSYVAQRAIEEILTSYGIHNYIKLY
ncbi:MAG: class I SAM-dependent methyltransferase [Chitinispirillia bacterium]|nr:class I SAM-dependent methyltransferase [Chitinispirillia bacterium]MCL2240982.1 class I SAM-dependent methyltransferase [Chitinispirillia bacterium]